MSWKMPKIKSTLFVGGLTSKIDFWVCFGDITQQSNGGLSFLEKFRISSD